MTQSQFLVAALAKQIRDKELETKISKLLAPGAYVPVSITYTAELCNLIRALHESNAELKERIRDLEARLLLP